MKLKEEEPNPLQLLDNLEPEDPKPKPKPQYAEERVYEVDKAIIMTKFKNRRGTNALMADNFPHMRVINLEKRGIWETIAEGNILTLKRNKETGVLILAHKAYRMARVGSYVVIANNEREIKRAIADLRRINSEYHQYKKGQEATS